MSYQKFPHIFPKYPSLLLTQWRTQRLLVLIVSLWVLKRSQLALWARLWKPQGAFNEVKMIEEKLQWGLLDEMRHRSVHYHTKYTRIEYSTLTHLPYLTNMASILVTKRWEISYGKTHVWNLVSLKSSEEKAFKTTYRTLATGRHMK